MKRRLTILGAVAGAAVLLSGPSAHAQRPAAPAAVTARPEPADQQALRLFQNGADRYREGKFAEAAELFRAAYQLKQEPVLLRNLARAYEGMEGRDAAQKAIDAYRAFLRASPDAEDRGAVDQRIKAIEERIEREAALERQRDEERGRAERAEQTRRAAEHAARTSALPWIVAGAGVLSAGVGVGFGLLANGSHAAAQEPGRDAIDAQDEQSQAKTFALVANVAFVVGALLGVGGLTWGIVDARRSGTSTRVAARGPGGEIRVEF